MNQREARKPVLDDSQKSREALEARAAKANQQELNPTVGDAPPTIANITGSRFKVLQRGIQFAKPKYVPDMISSSIHARARNEGMALPSKIIFKENCTPKWDKYAN